MSLGAKSLLSYKKKNKDNRQSSNVNKTVDDIIYNLTETSNGNGITKNFEKSSGYNQTLNDIDRLNPTLYFKLT